MSRVMVGFQTFLMLVLFIGTEVGANSIESCESNYKFSHNMHRFVSEENPLDIICKNVTDFFLCANEVVEEEYGYNLEQMADLLQGSEMGSVLRIFANIQKLLQELCTEGNQFREDYLANSECIRGIDRHVGLQCETQGYASFVTFNELQTSGDPSYQTCIVAAYQLGCLGTKIKEECGEQGFGVYKEIVRKVGFFKSGICSAYVMGTIKTSFIDSLDMEESRKNTYRLVAQLRKRRK